MTLISRCQNADRMLGSIASIAILLGFNSQTFAQSAQPSSGNGLLGEYKSGSTTASRIDSVVDFNWGSRAPLPNISADNFTVKWTGKVEAPATDLYTFNIQADDGLRLWVDGKLVIDATDGYYPSWYVSGHIPLTAGRRYDIRLEYTEKTGNAAVQLSWRRPGQERQTIPQNRLYSTSLPIAQTGPTNLVALGYWRNTCCNGKPMAHIELSWSRPVSASPAMSTFNVYRDGTLIKSGVTSTSWEDMGVSSGRTYTYQVSGVGADGREGMKSETSSATAPFPPTGGWTAPTNLRIQGIWATPANRPTDVLTWDPVPSAVRYNVYLYDRLIGSSTSDSTFTVPVADYYKSLTYTVTAVNSKGEETLPSNIVGAQGSHNPAYPPSAQTKPPKPPITLRAATEWNAGSPRVRLTWLGGAEAYTYDIYRDGKKVARGVWGQIWFDGNVRPGEQHTYAVTGVNKAWYLPVESPLSSSVSTVVTGQPILNAAARVAVKKIVPNDDSVMVYFDAVPGAQDYRVSDVTKPGSYKYSAGSLSVEMNGLVPGKPTNLIVEAVDKFGPFQKMDGMLGPGATTHDGHVNMAINGFGDPSN
ncbi:MAG: hypothetical protein H8F28_21605, partial [Fibrella sp.]|nr:hypothetical protein [Armatimonadota bacterium]